MYTTEDGVTKIDLKLFDDTVWLNQMELAELFQTTKNNVSMHIKNIFEDGELDKAATVKDFLTVQNEAGRDVERKITYYSLDMILAIGYRVRSPRKNKTAVNRMATFQMLYQSQFDWDVNKYNALYFVLNKAIYNEQDYLRLLNPKLMTNTTKAIIKAHINHYHKFEIYEKFPNLAEIANQRPLDSEIVLAKEIRLNTVAFREMNLID